MRTWILTLALVVAGPAYAPTYAQDAPAKAPAHSDAVAAGSSKIHWYGWSDDVFAQAKREHKFVLLDLEAVWCHWCHVMDANTYSDAKVQKLMQAKYLAVKVDQDSRPDLSNRYEDYGWPATVVFDGNGQEIVKRQGYLDPDEFAGLLQAIIDDPTPGPSVHAEVPIVYPSNPLLPDKLRNNLRAMNIGGYDSKEGAWGNEDRK